MRFYNRPHQCYCGIDLHVTTMYVCILDSTGQVLVHRNMPSTATAFLEVVKPYRDDLVVAAECMFTWYWLADVCAAEGSDVRARPRAGDEGHSRRARRRTTRSTPTRSPCCSAAGCCRKPTSTRLRCGRPATCCADACTSFGSAGSCSPTFRTSTRQYNLPAFAKRLAYPGNRDGVVEHFPDPVVRKSIAVDVVLIDQYDALINDLELTIVREAKQHDGDAFHRLRSVPGIGKVLALTILYEIHDITRFDRVQE